MKEIHLIHHSHTDYGYTDAPSTAIKLHLAYLHQAIQVAFKERKRTPQARFRWTCEVYDILEKYLLQYPQEKKKVVELVSAGLLEVCAMPNNVTGLWSQSDIASELARASRLLKKIKSAVAFQNDINGFSWGMIPLFQKEKVDLLWMGLNLYSGGYPFPAPAFFKWKGPKNSWIYGYNGFGYNMGISWFYEKEWRKGPIPSAHDYWYHPPQKEDLFTPSKNEVEQTHLHFSQKLDELLKQGYPYSYLALQVTNMWRLDNDPCIPHLPAFVELWNKSGKKPQLVLSTPSLFWKKIKPEVEKLAPTYQGDWPDWWADLLPQAPREAAWMMEASRLNQDNRGLQKKSRRAAQFQSSIEQNAQLNIAAQEHTFNSYNSVAEPYHDLTLFNTYEKGILCLNAKEAGLSLRKSIVESLPTFVSARKTESFQVINPGERARSGWVTLPLDLLPPSTQSVKELRTKKLYPLLPVYQTTWGSANDQENQNPTDCWPYQIKAMRFYLDSIPKGESRQFHYSTDAAPTPATLNKNSPKFNADGLSSYLDQQGKPLVQANETLGKVRIERYRGKFIKPQLEKRSPDHRKISFELESCASSSKAETTPYGLTKTITHEYSGFGKVRSQFWIPNDSDLIAIEYDFDLIESPEATTVYIDFPIHLEKSKVFYSSTGTLTEPQVDQMPNTCPDHYLVGQEVLWKNTTKSVLLQSWDAPVGAFHQISTRCGNHQKPQTGRFYSMPLQFLWMTNVTLQKAGRYRFRYFIRPCSSSIPNHECGELITFPSLSK